jgi:Tfp pilus assembly protein PilW
MISLAILLVLVLVVFQDRRAYYLSAQVKRLQENNDWLEAELFDLHKI